jgi:hypothetical protein
MQKRKTEKTGEFVTIGSNGKSYRVIEYTEFVNSPSLEATQDSWEPMLKAYRLEDGSRINMVSHGVFEIAGTSITLKVGSRR